MRMTYKNVENCLNERINIVKKDQPCLDSAWHYHPQYELIYISKSHGIRFVGDSVAHFAPGDLVLVGSYLPHLWRNDIEYYESKSDQTVETIVLKFMKDFIGKGTFGNIEFLEINKLLEESKYGLSFGSDISEELSSDLLKITSLSPGEQSIKLLELLFRLSETEEKMPLSSTDMRQYNEQKNNRLDIVIKYISDNYNQDITLQVIADIACMTTNSFCRFFKKNTNKSFNRFLNEVRIRNAARLLIQRELPVSQVCYMVGYKSITNFYRQFKEITGHTPKRYAIQVA